MLKVAISPSLSHLKGFLSDEGIEAVDFEGNFIGRGEDITALVISGVDANYLGRQNVSSAVPVINAHGLTDAEISAEIKRKGRRV